MNFDHGEINLTIAALKYTAMSFAELAKKNAGLIGQRQAAENQGQFAHGCAALANRLEREARAQNVPIHMTGH